MILLARGAGDPDRVALARTIAVPASLDEVAAAVTEYAQDDGAVYVERHGDRFRWSPAVHGGAYPLMRVVARFLGCRHTDITVGYATVDGWCVVADPGADAANDGFTLLEDVVPDRASIRSHVRARLDAAPRGGPTAPAP